MHTNIKCSYCGAENPAPAVHCSGCGLELEQVNGVPESLVSSKSSAWILATFQWALEQFGTDYFHDGMILVTPTPEHFPSPPKDPVERAAAIFRRVQEHAGLENWPCRLEAQDPDANPVIDPLTILEGPTSPAGTFGYEGEVQPEAVITYNPAELQRPQALVATFAHELAHYLGFNALVPPPGGEEQWEPATDLLAVYLGFGIFLANSAIQFEPFSAVTSQGWQSRKLGYLSEFELVYCLALFCTLKGIAREQVVPHLKDTVVEVYDNAIADLRRHIKAVQELRELKTGGGAIHKQS